MENNATLKNHGGLKKALFFLKFLEIRLRFVMILAVTALVVGYWDHIQNYFERWQRNHGTAQAGQLFAAGASENEFEYFCPMHPFVVRDRAGKCPICGMDLVQRQKGAPAALPAGTLARVQASPERIAQAGVQVEPVAYRLLTRAVQSYGVIEPDETREAKIIARFPGRIEKLMVNAVGMKVQKGEPLARIYSPKFLAAIQEYAQALKAEGHGQANASNGRSLSDMARQRLLLAGFTEEQIDGIKASVNSNGNSNDNANDAVTLDSPLTGTVLEKNAVQGDSVEEGTALYAIADLSKVWVQAQVIESDLSAIKEKMPVEVTTVSYPGEIFFGTVDFISPTLDVENRSVKARVIVDNAAGKLKPGMYVTATMRSPVGHYEYENSADKSVAPDLASTPAAAPVKLPTTAQADADRYLAGLAPGADYYACPMDGDVVSDKPGDCPKCGMHLEKKTKEKAAVSKPGATPAAAPEQNANASAAAPMTMTTSPETQAKTAAAMAASNDKAARPSNERWAEGYSCEMHPGELSDKPGICSICGCGMKLKKIKVERTPSIPEMAVIDTGKRYVVYVESAPGVFDAREVKLGARAGAYYPVLDGLKLGDRIVSRGSFLIDAEARLNPAPANASEPGSGGH